MLLEEEENDVGVGEVKAKGTAEKPRSVRRAGFMVQGLGSSGGRVTRSQWSTPFYN